MRRDEADELRRQLLSVKETPQPHDDWAEQARLGIHGVEVERVDGGEHAVVVRFDQGPYRHLYRHQHLDRTRPDPVAEAVAVIWHEVVCEPHGDLVPVDEASGLRLSGDA